MFDFGIAYATMLLGPHWLMVPALVMRCGCYLAPTGASISACAEHGRSSSEEEETPPSPLSLECVP